MAAKLQTSRRRSGADEEPDLESLSTPAATQIQGDQQLQMPQAPQRSNADLSRHEIRDRVAMGGMSSLELQSLIRSNHFLTDEDIAAYTGGSHGGGRAGMQISAPTSIAPPPENVFAARGGPAPHSGPIGGHDALGFEGALAPQGLMSPQGVMTKVGMLGFVKGLLGVRSDGPQPGSMQPKGSNQGNPQSSAASKIQSPSPSATASPARSNEQPAPRPQNSATQAPSPDATPKASPTADASPQSARESSAFQPVQNAFESSQAFQPVQPEGNNWIQNAMWGKSQSPFVEIIRRFFSMLKSIFGSQNNVPPHLRGGKH